MLGKKRNTNTQTSVKVNGGSAKMLLNNVHDLIQSRGPLHLKLFACLTKANQLMRVALLSKQTK